MLDTKISPRYDTEDGIKSYYVQAQLNELNAEVRMLREELQQLREQRSPAREVLKAMDKEEVLVRIPSESIPVVDIARDDTRLQEPESESSEDEQSDEYWSAGSEISEEDESERKLSREYWPGEIEQPAIALPEGEKWPEVIEQPAIALPEGEKWPEVIEQPAIALPEGETWPEVIEKPAIVLPEGGNWPGEMETPVSVPPEDDPEGGGSFSFTKLAGALAVGATVGAAVVCPATLPLVAFNGVRVVLATKSIEDDPVTGTIGTIATLALECMVPCASSAKYLVQTGKSLHRVKDLSQVAYGAKLLVQTGNSIHRVGAVARYGWSVASVGFQAVTSVAAHLTSDSKSEEPDKRSDDKDSPSP